MARTDSGKTRLHLDGLSTPIFTHVTRQTETGMTVEQPLPFLRLHTGVLDDTKRLAHIESVSMLVLDGVPRLVLDLAYAQVEEPQTVVAREQAVASHAGIMRRSRPDETVPFDLEAAASDGMSPVKPSPAPMPLALPDAEREQTLTFQTLRAEAADADTPLTLEEQLLVSHQYSYRLKTWWKTVRPTLVVVRDRSWSFLRLVWRKAYPVIKLALAKTRDLALQLRARLRDHLEARKQARSR